MCESEARFKGAMRCVIYHIHDTTPKVNESNINLFIGAGANPDVGRVRCRLGQASTHRPRRRDALLTRKEREHSSTANCKKGLQSKILIITFIWCSSSHPNGRHFKAH